MSAQQWHLIFCHTLLDDEHADYCDVFANDDDDDRDDDDDDDYEDEDEDADADADEDADEHEDDDDDDDEISTSIHFKGEVLETSHDLAPKSSQGREIPLFQEIQVGEVL